MRKKKKNNKKGYLTCKQALAILQQKFSFTVRFKRSRNLSEVIGKGGDWVPSPGRTVTSTRRFPTATDARRHGKRFSKIEGHKGFKVVKTKDRPTDWVNVKTGKTNPIVGRGRTNR